MHPIQIIGVGLGQDDLTVKHRAIIARADLLVGGRRLLEYFKECPAEKRLIDADIKELIAFLKRRIGRKSIVVLASGDPLFFGIGATLIEAFGPDRVAVHPNVSSVAAAFARIKEPWDGVPVFSLHGRKYMEDWLPLLADQERVAVLTDPERSPGWLAKLLLEKLGGGFRMAVMEGLGTEQERYGWYALNDAARMEFGQPNLVVLKHDPEAASEGQGLFLGTPDERYDHHRGLITKPEVRAVAISKLRLLSNHVLWDLGAGSGSIAIESSLLVGKGRIVAVEKDLRRIGQIKANAARFGVRNLAVVQAVLPAGLERLPKPHRIFIGGGGKDLCRIITAAVRFLRPGGRVVVNTVIMASVHSAIESLKDSGCETEWVQVQIHRGQEMPWGERLEALNPVWIITGIRKQELGRRKAEGGSVGAEGGKRKGKAEFGGRKLEGRRGEDERGKTGRKR